MTPRGALTYLEAFHFVGQELYGGDWQEEFLELVLPVTADNYLRYLLADHHYTEEEQQQTRYVHWLILRLLKKHRSSFILKSTTDKGPPAINPFGQGDCLYKFEDMNKSLINHVRMPDEYAYFLYIKKAALKDFIKKRHIEPQRSEKRETIDTDLFVQLMNDKMWSHRETIYSHGGKKNFILNTVLPEYLSERSYHINVFKNESYLDNKEIASRFQSIKHDVLTGMAPECRSLPEEQKTLVCALKDYQWQWHFVLGMKPRQRRSVASQALKQFVCKLPTTLSLPADQLQLFAILEKNSAKGYLHWHVLINDVLRKKRLTRIKTAIAELWSDISVNESHPCSRPVITDEEWFNSVYCRSGIIHYMIKEWREKPEDTEIFDNAIFYNCEFKRP